MTRTLHLVELDADPRVPFPPAEGALAEPDGLLAIGGDLTPDRLLNAYRNGIFPWFSEGEPILWWSPSRRAVFRTDGIHVASRFRRALRTSPLHVRADTAFPAVIRACAAAPRPGQSGTWITDAMVEGYVALHRLGHAHSIEVFDGTDLVGGLYGVAVGRMFCGESMFSARPDASKIALLALARHLQRQGWPLIDAQVPNAHTQSLGVEAWPRDAYLQALHDLRGLPGATGSWTARFGEIAASGLARPHTA